MFWAEIHLQPDWHVFNGKMQQFCRTLVQVQFIFYNFEILPRNLIQ